MIFDISHRTHYRYSQPVAQSQHVAHMLPRATPHQVVLSSTLRVDPAPDLRAETVDSYGNKVTLLDIDTPHEQLVLHAVSRVETSAPSPIGTTPHAAWTATLEGPRLPDGTLDLDTIQFRSPSRFTPLSPAVADYAAASFADDASTHDVAMDITRRMFRDFRFDASATDVSTPIEFVLRERRGVCQDFAHLALACLRSRHIPARYVSGYILTRPAPGQPKLQGADASHAWISVWSAADGWRDFDPTNGIAVGEEHVTVAYGADYFDVAPITGVLLGGGDHSVSVEVDVTPLG